MKLVGDLTQSRLQNKAELPFFSHGHLHEPCSKSCQPESAFRGLGAPHSTSCWCTCCAFPWGVRKFLQNTEGKSYPGDVLTVPYTKEKKSSQKLGSTGSSSQDDGGHGGLCPSLLAAGPHGWWLGDVPRKVWASPWLEPHSLPGQLTALTVKKLCPV